MDTCPYNYMIPTNRVFTFTENGEIKQVQQSSAKYITVVFYSYSYDFVVTLLYAHN